MKKNNENATVENIKTIALHNFEFDYVSLGIDVKEARLMMGWTQGKLGEAIGYTGRFISGLETANTENSYTIESFLSIVNFLQLDPRKYWDLNGGKYATYVETTKHTYETIKRVE